RARREPAHDVEVAEGQLAHDAGKDDEREQHAEQQVEQVVAGVDGGEADTERDAEEIFPLARELQLAGRPKSADETAPERGRRRTEEQRGFRSTRRTQFEL